MLLSVHLSFLFQLGPEINVLLHFFSIDKMIYTHEISKGGWKNGHAVKVVTWLGDLTTLQAVWVQM